MISVSFAAKQVTAAQRGILDAVKDGNIQTLEMMVKNGASINEHDATKDHFTPLHWACHIGSLEVCCSFMSAWLSWHTDYNYIIDALGLVFTTNAQKATNNWKW